MPKYGSPSIGLLVDGYSLLSAKLKDLRYKIQALTESSHGLGDAWEETSPTGLRRAELVQEGAFFNTAAGNIHEVLGTASRETIRQVLMFFGGNSVGAACVAAEATYAHTYEVLAEIGKLQKANVLYAISGRLYDAVIVRALSAYTAAGNTQSTPSDHAAETDALNIPITSSSIANPTVITTPVPHQLTTGDTVIISDHTGSTPAISGEYTVTVTGTTTFTIAVNVTTGGTGGSFVKGKTQNGGVGFIQCTALSLGGYTNTTVALRHSVDNVTYVDLLTFTARTAIGAEQVSVAGTVNRYLATSHTFGGAGSGPSVTCLVAFARL